jgi:hypothetical protein
MQPQPLHELLQDLEQELLRLGYTQGTMTFYRNRWRKLEDFADRKGQLYYTEQLGIDFVWDYFGIPQDDFSRTLNQAQTQELRVIRMVGDFQLHHAVLRRYLKHRELLTDPYFIQTSRRFEDYCVATKEYSNATVGHYTKQSGYFMDYLAAQGMHDFSGVSMDTIHTYILTLSGFSYKTVEQHICSTLCLLSVPFWGRSHKDRFRLEDAYGSGQKATIHPIRMDQRGTDKAYRSHRPRKPSGQARLCHHPACLPAGVARAVTSRTCA